MGTTELQNRYTRWVVHGDAASHKRVNEQHDLWPQYQHHEAPACCYNSEQKLLVFAIAVQMQSEQIPQKFSSLVGFFGLCKGLFFFFSTANIKIRICLIHANVLNYIYFICKCQAQLSSKNKSTVFLCKLAQSFTSNFWYNESSILQD